jgi:hypothetical protein
MTARGGVAWRWAPLLAAVAVAVAWRGGYTAGGRGVVAALAGLAALVVAAASVPAPWGHAGVLLIAALASAVIGLAATIATSEPLALNLCGSWRPAGPFEYPPALALVCAGALPVALCAATERRRAVAAAGALAAWLLVTTVAPTANRTGIGLSALAVTACVALAPRARVVGPVALAIIVAATASALIVHGDLARAGDAARVLAPLPVVIVLGAALWTGSRPSAWGRGRWTALVATAGILATTRVVLGDRGSPCGANPSHGRVGIWHAALATAAERPVQGYGAGTFLAATRAHQLEQRPVPTRFAHDLGLQEWVELGIAGLLAVLAWYAAVAWTLALELWPRHPRVRAAQGAGAPVNGAVWLLAPAVAAFPLANLLDWPWALTGTGALWALAVGGLLAGRRADARPDTVGRS